MISENTPVCSSSQITPGTEVKSSGWLDPIRKREEPWLSALAAPSPWIEPKDEDRLLKHRLEKLDVPQLKFLCKMYGVVVSGKKGDLVDRTFAIAPSHDEIKGAQLMPLRSNGEVDEAALRQKQKGLGESAAIIEDPSIRTGTPFVGAHGRGEKSDSPADTIDGSPASVDATAGSPASVDAPLDAGSPVFGFGRAAMAWDMDVQDTQPRGDLVDVSDDLVLALHSEDVQGDLVEPVTCLEKDEKASDGETAEPTISPYSVCGKCGRHILFSEECAFCADGTASNQNGTKVEKAEKTDRGSLAQASFQAAVAAWHNRPRHPVEPVEEPKQIRKTVPSE